MKGAYRCKMAPLMFLEKQSFLVLAAAKRVFVFVIGRTVGDAQTVADGFFGYCLSMGQDGKNPAIAGI